MTDLETKLQQCELLARGLELLEHFAKRADSEFLRARLESKAQRVLDELLARLDQL